MPRTAKAGAWLVAAAIVVGLLLTGLQALGGTAHADQSVGTEHLPLAGPADPDKVVAGVYVSNIQQVDLATNSFDADFYVWLRWSNPDIDPTAGIEIMNVYQSWALTQTPIYEEPRKQADGSLVWLVRYQGSFNSTLSLSDYPFEDQTLKIVIEDGEQNIKQIVYEPDRDPIKLDSAITLAGYEIGRPRIEFGTNTYDTSFGEIDSTVENRTYTRIVVEIPVSSPVTSGIVKIILPVLTVLVASSLGLIIPAAYVDSKVNVPITALIALVAMHFVVSASLPQVGYLLMIDLVYILAYIAVTVMLGGAVMGAWKLKTAGEDAAMALERRFLVWTGAGFLLSLVAVLLLYLPEGALF